MFSPNLQINCKSETVPSFVQWEGLRISVKALDNCQKKITGLRSLMTNSPASYKRHLPGCPRHCLDSEFLFARTTSLFTEFISILAPRSMKPFELSHAWFLRRLDTGPLGLGGFLTKRNNDGLSGQSSFNAHSKKHPPFMMVVFSTVVAITFPRWRWRSRRRVRWSACVLGIRRSAYKREHRNKSCEYE